MALLDVLFPVLCVLAVCTNALLIGATLRSSQLLTPCHLLIALDALIFGAFVAPYGVEMYVVPVFFGGSITLAHCFVAQIPFMFGIGVTVITPLMIAVERMLNVFFPIWAYQRQNSTRFAAMLAIPALLHGCFQVTYLGVRTFNELNTSASTACAWGQISSAFPTFALCKNLVASGVCWVVYASIWMRARRRTQEAATTTITANWNKKFRRLTRSMVIVTAMFTVVWTTPSTLLGLLSMVHLPTPIVSAIYTPVAVLTSAIGAGAMPVFLYALSEEHRAAINGFLTWIGVTRIFHYCRCNSTDGGAIEGFSSSVAPTSRIFPPKPFAPLAISAHQRQQQQQNADPVAFRALPGVVVSK